MEALTYDDIQLIPNYSEIKSRNDVDLTTQISRNFKLDIPLVASPMDTVCEVEMAKKLMDMGGVGCVHRFMDMDSQAEAIQQLFNYRIEIQKEHLPIMGAVGVGDDEFDRAHLLIQNGCDIILIDVAHGYHKNVKDMLKSFNSLKENSDFVFDVIAGNIADSNAAMDLCRWGADGLRVGIGGGCFTPDMEVRTKDGLKAIKDIEIGDEVYTHTGELKPVINKFEYEDYDEIYDIDGIEVTGNHKLYVVHQSKEDLVDDGNIHEYAEWVKAEDLTDEYLLIEL